MNAFERLSLPLNLSLSDEEIQNAFLKLAAMAHPDSGGDLNDFTALRDSREILLSPAKRLREWLRAHKMDTEERGSISAGLIDLFQKVANLGSSAEGVIRKSYEASSVLTRSLAEVSRIREREAIQSLLREIETEITTRVGEFSGIQNGSVQPAMIQRDLTFLEKWRTTMKSLYGRLI